MCKYPSNDVDPKMSVLLSRALKRLYFTRTWVGIPLAWNPETGPEQHRIELACSELAADVPKGEERDQCDE